MTSAPRALLLRYLTAAVLVRIADEGTRVALVLLALERTGNVALAGGLIAAFLAPHLLAAPAVGLFADHVSQRKLLHVCALGVVALSIAGCGLAVGHVPNAVALVIAAIGGCAGPLLTGGMSSLPVLLLPAASLPRAYAADGATYNTSSVLGPALAAGSAALFGAPAATFLLAGSIVVGACVLATLPIPNGRGGPDRPSLRGLGDGIAALWRQPTLRAVTVASTCSQFGIGALPVIAALIATEYGGTTGAGVLLSVFGLCGLIGAVANTTRPVWPEQPERVSIASLLAVSVPFAVVPFVDGFVVTAVLFGAAGLLAGPFVGSLLSVRQRYAPEEHRTQVFMVAAGLRSTAAAAGAAVAGAAAGAGVGVLVAVIAAIHLVAGVAADAAIRRNRGTRRTSRDPAPPLPIS